MQLSPPALLANSEKPKHGGIVFSVIGNGWIVTTLSCNPSDAASSGGLPIVFESG